MLGEAGRGATLEMCLAKLMFSSCKYSPCLFKFLIWCYQCFYIYGKGSQIRWSSSIPESSKALFYHCCLSFVFFNVETCKDHTKVD